MLTQKELTHLVSQLTTQGVIPAKYRWEPLNQGSSNQSIHYYNPQDQGFIITVVWEKNSTQTQELFALLSHLAQHHFPTHQPVDLTSFNNRPVLIKRYLQGETLSPLNPSQLQAIGTRLAQLHTIPLPKELPPPPATFHLPLLQQHPHHWQEQLHTPQPFSDWLEQTSNTPAQEHFCHGDLFWDNILWHQEKCLFIDFEEAHRGDPLWDIAMAILGLELTPEQLPQLLQGYLKNSSKTLCHDQLTYYLVACAATVATWRQQALDNALNQEQKQKIKPPQQMWKIANHWLTKANER